MSDLTRLLTVFGELEREMASMERVRHGGLVPAHWPNQFGPAINPEWEDVWDELRKRRIEATAEPVAAVTAATGGDADGIREDGERAQTRGGDGGNQATARGR